MNFTPKDVPAEVISAAEQEYAEVNSSLDLLIEQARQGMAENPEWVNSLSVIWKRSAVDYHDHLCDGLLPALIEKALHKHTADIMIAAIFRLAQQQ